MTGLRFQSVFFLSLCATVVAGALCAERLGAQVLLPPLPPVHVGPEIAPNPLPVLNHGFATDVDVAGPLSSIVQSLSVLDIRQREDATEKLLRLPPARLDDIAAALEKATDPEAIARLQAVAAHLYLKPRTLISQPSLMGLWFKDPAISLLGISYFLQDVQLNKDDLGTSHVAVVSNLEPGFPAAQMLRVGDRIFAFNGKSFPEDLDPLDGFPQLVRKFSPGDLVRVGILRAGQQMEVTVEMGGFAGDDADLRTLIQTRLEAAHRFLDTLKTGRPDSPVIGEGPAGANSAGNAGNAVRFNSGN